MSRALAIFACLLVLAACDEETPDVDAGTDAGARDAGTDAGGGYDAGAYARIPESEAAAGRESCAFGRGAMPWETIGEEHPISATRSRSVTSSS